MLERFVEAQPERVRFHELGMDGELWFEFGDELYVVLSEEEALEIVQRELAETLFTLSPETLLEYTTLPDSGRELLAGIQGKTPEVANSLLGGLIDLPLLAQDRVRQEGYSAFFRGDSPEAVEDLRFGEWVIIRMSPGE